MKKIIYLLLVMFAFSKVYGQDKNNQTKTLGQDSNSKIESMSQGLDFYKSINSWEKGTYLVFNSKEEIASTYEKLKRIANSNEESKEKDSCAENIALDKWESTKNGFVSMRKAYENQECGLLEAEFTPIQVKDIPVLNDALSTLISPSGIVQVGNEINYFSASVYAKAPLKFKKRLKGILNGEYSFSPRDTKNGIEITVRGKGNCSASFTVDVNHITKSAHVTYTGTDISTGDKKLIWDVDGTNNHENETSFTKTYNNVGSKTICVTYSEYDVVTDTTFYYITTLVDTTITTTNGDSTVQIKKTIKRWTVDQVKQVVCTDQFCKTFNIGECTADFDYVVGIDNKVHFSDNSSTPYGTITGYLWQFGDGQTSTEQYPTHTYECDKEYTVTLIIYSDQCPNGTAKTEQTIDASGINCCDKNPESNWKYKINPSDSNKRIKYRYDMGTNWNWLFDQDFKAKIKYYEYRRGCCFWNKKKKWRKTSGNLDVDFHGKVFAKDEDGCYCQVPANLTAQPPYKNAKTYTFQDDLSSSAFSSDKTYWMKLTSPVYIEYRVNGTLYVTQDCNSEPGFHCE